MISKRNQLVRVFSLVVPSTDEECPDVNDMFFFGNWTINTSTDGRTSLVQGKSLLCLCHTNRNHDVLARTRCHQWSVSAATTVVYLTVDVESSLFFEAKHNTLSERRELASTESGPVGKNVCLGLCWRVNETALCWRVNDTALGSYTGRGPVTAGRHLVGNLELIRR